MAGRLAVLAALALLAACESPTGLAPSAPASARSPHGPKAAHDPILFVHGWNASGSTWTTMISRFRKDGWTSKELANWSYDADQSNATTAAQIAVLVDSIRAATGAARVDIVTHSMGSLSARYYVRNLGGDGKVDALVSLGGPNHGTTTSNFCFTAACLEMRPTSQFLSDLNGVDETWGDPRYATWRSPCDAVIQPNDSPVLDGANNVLTSCLSHSQLHEDARVYRQVRDWVK